MKKLYSSAIVMLSAVGALLASAAPAFAGTHVDLSIGVGIPGARAVPPAIYAPPPPVYAPPQAIYAPPPPAYVSPITVYRAAPPAFAYDYRNDAWRRHEWREHREHEWRERREREWHERHDDHRRWRD